MVWAALGDGIIPALLPIPPPAGIWKLIGHKVLPVSAHEAATWLEDELYAKLLLKCETRPVVVSWDDS